MTKNVISSDSDEDSNISNVQEIKEAIRELLDKKKDCLQENNNIEETNRS